MKSDGETELSLDATYKLIEGDRLILTPVLTQDNDNKIRTVCFIVSQHENFEYVAWGLNVLKEWLSELFSSILRQNFTYVCKYFMSDGAQ